MKCEVTDVLETKMHTMKSNMYALYIFRVNAFSFIFEWP